MNRDANIYFFCWIVFVVCGVLGLKLKFGLSGKSRMFYGLSFFVYFVPMPLVILSEIYDSILIKLIAFLTGIPAFFFGRYIVNYLHAEKN